MLVIIMTFDKHRCEKSKVNTQNSYFDVISFLFLYKVSQSGGMRVTTGIAVTSRHLQCDPHTTLRSPNACSFLPWTHSDHPEGPRTWLQAFNIFLCLFLLIYCIISVEDTRILSRFFMHLRM